MNRPTRPRIAPDLTMPISRRLFRHAHSASRTMLPWFPVGMGLMLPLLAFAGLLSLPTGDALAAADSGSGVSGPSSVHSGLPARAPAFFQAFTPEVQRWSDHIMRWSTSYDLAPELIAVVMQIESCGHPRVRSSAGALGLFQVMPFHFQEGEDPLDPQTNARRGLSYLARSLDLSDGQIDLALAGYNGGHGVIDRDPNTWAPETRRYVQWGMGIIEDISRGELRSPQLDAWLAAGGENLCRRASVELEG